MPSSLTRQAGGHPPHPLGRTPLKVSSPPCSASEAPGPPTTGVGRASGQGSRKRAGVKGLNGLGGAWRGEGMLRVKIKGLRIGGDGSGRCTGWQRNCPGQPPLSAWSKGMSTPGLGPCISHMCPRLTGRPGVESPLLPRHGKDRSWNKAWGVEQRVLGP